MTSPHILVVDDEPDIRELVREILEDEGFDVATAANGAEARARREERRPALILLDIWMPDVDGITLLREWHEEEGGDAPPVIMISGHATVESAVEATRLGAWDFLEKPLALAKLLLTVRHALEADQLRHENLRLRRHQGPQDEPVGRSPAITRLREAAQRAANHDAPIFLVGEAGSGKRSLARYIHTRGPRSHGPLVEVSAATLSGTEAAAAIFGQEDDGGIRYGLLERASGGTLFLSHVGQLSEEAQMLLLAALETGLFQRRGGHHQQPLNVRLIAADLDHLDEAVASGRFRRELYDRLTVICLALPPLRERLEDLPDLVTCYSNHFVTEEGLPFRDIGVAAQNRLRQHPWPGNLRELRNVLHRLSLVDGDQEVTREEVEAALPTAPGARPPATGSTEAPMAGLDFHRPLREARENFERAYLAHHMGLHDGRVGEVARAAGMERTHLYRKLRSLGLHPRQGGGED